MLNDLVLFLSDLAGIQYAGTDGISIDCVAAVRRLVLGGPRIQRVRVLTNDQRHALLLTCDDESLVAVKSGFASGYSGEGPKAFAEVLELFEVIGSDLEEHEVSAGLMRRLGASALTVKDLEELDASVPVRPQRFGDYILCWRGAPKRAFELLASLPEVMPWTVVDPDLIDLALSFFDGPDKAILDAFRRLEDKVRKRAGLQEHGAKLFSQAFSGDGAPLVWDGLDKGEQIGRMQLFTGAYQTFRNPRAHRSAPDCAGESLSEFLMVNQLFRLERQAMARHTA